MKRSSDELIELEPYGVTASADGTRPVMLFRAIESKEILPVWLSPIDAGIAITQHHVQSSSSSPHDLTLKILEALNTQLESCIFSDLKGHHQFVELFFSGSRKLKSLTARADQAMSFAIHSRARFFCTKSYITDSKVVNAEMVGVTRDLKLNPKMGQNRHPYLN